MKLKTIFLCAAVITGILGWADVGSFWINGPARPLSAILFCLFMIVRLLEGEMALYDAQQDGATSHQAKG